MPKISVIVPIYKVEKYLRRCVDSILAQTFTDFELILVDDGSPDSCGKICDEYAKKDSRVVVVHKENGGLSDARNAGIDWAFENSDSEWITFIDSDDWVHPQYLEMMLDGAVNNKSEISVCGYLETDTEKSFDKIKDFHFDIRSTEEFFVNSNVNAVVAWGKLYKKILFKDIRYPVGKLHEDEFTTYKLLFKYENVAVTEEKLYYYFVNNDSIMRSGFSIRNLDAIDAFIERIKFFENMKKNDLVKWQRKHTMYYLQARYMLCVEAEKTKETENAALIIKKNARALIKNNKRNVPLKGNEWFYEVAYPNFMKIYWVVKAQLDKIRK